jgi:glutamate formiminotransferase/formiminotetrahydrofolate cyclodeaminase
MLIDQTIAAFADELASNSPAPGGGSIAALAGTLGAGLTSMVCRLTIGKKKYADVQDEIQSVLAQSEELRAQLMVLIDKDTDAFTGVMNAFGLPKDSEDEKTARAGAIQLAMKEAVRVPLEVMNLCVDAIGLTAEAATIGNANSVTDAGVAALMIQAASKGAGLNVKVNLGAIADKEFCGEVATAVNEYEISIARIAQEIISGVEARLLPLA